MGPRETAGVWRPDIEAERRAHLQHETGPASEPAPVSRRGDAANEPSLASRSSSAWVAGGVGVATIAAIVWMLGDFSSHPDKPGVAAIETAAAAKAGAAAPATPAPPPAVASIAPRESLARNESVVIDVPAASAGSSPKAVPVVAPAKPAARPIRKPAPVRNARPPSDARIRSQVQARLEANQSISGKIGVEIEGATVRLTGYTLTPTQARLAEREARSVPGVRGVRNEIRPRVGGPRS